MFTLNVDLCCGYMFYGLGAHVVYANLNTAQIHKKMVIMTAVVLILKANTAEDIIELIV